MGRRRAGAASAEPAAVPRHLDLVVAAHGDRWAVGPFGSRAQVSFATLDLALAHARAFAATRLLDVWLTRDGVSFARDTGRAGRDPAGG